MNRTHSSFHLFAYSLASLVLVLLCLLMLSSPTSGSGNGTKQEEAATGKIAFLREENDVTRLYTMKPDGSHLTRVTTPPNEQDNDTDPSFSCDGRDIVFVSWYPPAENSTRNGLINDIYVVQADGKSASGKSPNGKSPNGSGRTRLTKTSGRYLSPVFSPDGKQIAFYSDEPVGLYLMNRQARSTPRIIWKPKSGKSPGLIQGRISFNPDGRKITFAANSDFKGKHGRQVGPISIYAVNTDGTGLKRLTNTFTNDLNPSFSPNGRKIVFSSGNGLVGHTYIHTMNSDGTGRKTINLFSAQERHSEDEPSFSPDGRQIVFTAGDHEYREIYVMDSIGKRSRRLTDNKFSETGAVWGK